MFEKHPWVVCEDGATPIRSTESYVAFSFRRTKELGIEISPLHGQPALVREDAQMIQEIWLVESWKGKVLNAAPEEHDDLNWFTLEDVEKLILASTEYLELLRQVLS